VTVYVDNMRMPATVGRLRAKWSHLVTDSPDIEELHAFAAGIGLKLEWFQEFSKHPPGIYRPHYDVADSARKRAVAAGALEIPWRETPNVLRRAREAAGRPA
jgi:hypothetical protein